MMVFQSEPYNDDDFKDAIGDAWDHIKKFNPEMYGYHWAPEVRDIHPGGSHTMPIYIRSLAHIRESSRLRQ